MSLIHEALEKIESEKKVIPSPSPVPSPRPENSKAFYGIAGVLLFFFILGAVYFLTQSPPPSPAPQVNVSGPEAETLPKVSSPKMPQPRGKSFSLTGITRVDGEWTAIINNELVRAGDRVDGALVTFVGQASASLEQGEGETLVLDLYGDSTGTFK